MRFDVKNKTKAKQYCFGTHTQSSAIISISSFYDEPVSLFQSERNKVERILRCTFNDVDQNGIGCMTKEDAIRIAQFANQVSERVDLLIVHCDAGISRSAGTCAAIMKYFTGDDSQIFDNPYFSPNMHCYRLVLNELFEAKARTV